MSCCGMMMTALQGSGVKRKRVVKIQRHPPHLKDRLVYISTWSDAGLWGRNRARYISKHMALVKSLTDPGLHNDMCKV
jgi:hypothetical protein